MTARSYVGSGRNASVTPLKGVDGIMGVVIMLSYLVGGKNLFPEDVDPESFVLEFTDGSGGRVAVLDDEQLSRLVDACAEAVGRHLKGLTMGSLKVYLSVLRHGRRPNGGVLPKISSSYSSATGRLVIAGRDYDQDVASGVFNHTPDWVQALADTGTW